MRKPGFGLAVLVLLILTSLPGQIAAAPLHYLPTDALPVDGGLTPFPSPDSPEQQTDLGQVASYQTSRTAADCARANSEVNISLKSFFGPAYGPLTQSEVNRWTSFFNKVSLDTDYFTEIAKGDWKRPRPYVASGEIKPCLPHVLGYSYPSGHAAISGVWARVLGQLDPARAKAFMTRADQIALDRVLGGVHYPTDIAAGKVLAEKIFEKLEANSEFQKDFQQAKP